jgi:plasmid rolling circle replication initiator protein Rep
MAETKKSPLGDNAGQAASPGGPEQTFKSRIHRYNEAKTKACQILEEIPYQISKFSGKKYVRIAKAFDAMCDCGNWLLFRHYYTKDQYKLKGANFCKKDRICPLCAIRRSAKATAAVHDKVLKVMSEQPDLKLSMMTLTVKNRPNLEQCKEHITRSLHRINKRRNDSISGRKNGSEFGKMVGGAFSFENKKGRNSGLWHPHIHGLVLHREDFHMCWSQAERQMVPGTLRNEWFKITGDSFHVHLSPVDLTNLVKKICEVTSYAMKFSSMNTADLLQSYLIFSGARLLRFYGDLYNLKVPTEMTDELLQGDLPYIDYMYRYHYGAGYALSPEETKKGVQEKEIDQEVQRAENRRIWREKRNGVVS